MKMEMLIRLSLVVALHLCDCDGSPVAGPFRVVLQHVEPCPSKLLDVPYPIHIYGQRDRKNVNIMRYMANFTTARTFGDGDDARIEFASWSSRGGWKENALLMKFSKACTTVKTYLPLAFKNVITRLRGTKNLHFQDCQSIPPDDYHVENVTLDLSVPPLIPAFYYGKWRVDVRVFERSSALHFICLRLLADVVPKDIPMG